MADQVIGTDVAMIYALHFFAFHAKKFHLFSFMHFTSPLK